MRRLDMNVTEDISVATMPWPPLPDALASLQHVHRVLLMDVTQDISVATTQEPTNALVWRPFQGGHYEKLLEGHYGKVAGRPIANQDMGN